MVLTKKRPGAWGFIIRDNEGDAVLAGAGNVSPLYDALMAETMACVKALEAANAQGISRIQIEGLFRWLVF
jgi:ribonuclease HI